MPAQIPPLRALALSFHLAVLLLAPLSLAAAEEVEITAGEALLPAPLDTPDLWIHTVGYSGKELYIGQPLEMSVQVQNRGTAAAAASTVLYLRSDDSGVGPDDIVMATDPIPALAPGEQVEVDAIVTFPEERGAYYVGACAEAVSGEVETANNCLGNLLVTVGSASPPDLTVEVYQVIDATPNAGEELTVYLKVSNEGDSGAGETTARFYVSTDADITTSDTEVATKTVHFVASNGASYPAAFPTAPDIPGTYYLGGCIDPVAGEAVTTNNCSPGYEIEVQPVFADCSVAWILDLDFAGAGLWGACRNLHSGPAVTLRSGAVVILEAGERVSLGDGFAVETGAALTVRTCGGDLCTEGDALDPGCHSCVQAVCEQDAFCCQQEWDDVCVAEVGSICQLTCP